MPGKTTKQEAMKFFLSPEGHPKDRIIINENSQIPKEGQFISLNGYPFLAKPNNEIDLPRPVIEMLRTRIATDSIQDSDGKWHHKDVPRITFTVLHKDVTGLEDPKNAVPPYVESVESVLS